MSVNPICQSTAKVSHVSRRQPSRFLSVVMRGFLPLLLAVSGVGSVWAQAYPNKPVKLVAPFPPGGPTDVIARVVGSLVEVMLGEP